MSCGKSTADVQAHLATTSNSDTYHWYTPWTPAYAVVTPMVSALMVQKVKALVVASSLNGNFGWKLCYRTATTNKDNPSGWTSLEAGDPHGSGPFCLGEFTVSLDGEMWVQFGVMYQSSSGAGDAQVMVSYAVRRS